MEKGIRIRDVLRLGLCVIDFVVILLGTSILSGPIMVGFVGIAVIVTFTKVILVGAAVLLGFLMGFFIGIAVIVGSLNVILNGTLVIVNGNGGIAIDVFNSAARDGDSGAVINFSIFETMRGNAFKQRLSTGYIFRLAATVF